MFLDGFIHTLRDYGVPASLTDAMDFYAGLEKGMAPDLDRLFLFGRLCFVRRPEQMDAYERAFAWHFYGVDLPRVAEGDPELLTTKQFREWLRDAIRKGELPPESIWTMSPDELMRRFWDTVREQMKEHHGGSRWVGTGGNSPFGHSGNAQGGVRVMGAPGKSSALKVIGERRYVDYAADAGLKGSNLRQALSSLKQMVPSGPRDALSLPETIDRTARNGGEIELVFEQSLADRIEVLLLIDNGGMSMFPFVARTRLLFSKMRDRFERLSTLFFHNTIYGRLYRDPRRSRGVATTEILKRKRETRVIVLGDASMAPAELLYPRGAIDWGEADDEASLVWLRRIADRFPRAVWLNPIPKENWGETQGHRTIERIGQVFPMEDLTLGGIKKAVGHLDRP